MIKLLERALFIVLKATPDWVPERVVRPIGVLYLTCVVHRIERKDQ